MWQVTYAVSAVCICIGKFIQSPLNSVLCSKYTRALTLENLCRLSCLCLLCLVFSCIVLCSLVFSCVLLYYLEFFCVLCSLVLSCVFLCSFVFFCIVLCSFVSGYRTRTALVVAHLHVAQLHSRLGHVTSGVCECE